jgi:hypothetical protein
MEIVRAQLSTGLIKRIPTEFAFASPLVVPESDAAGELSPPQHAATTPAAHEKTPARPGFASSGD